MSVKEKNLLKALSDMEAIAKGGVSPGTSGEGNKTPTSTSQANGGLSDEGNKKELSVSAKKSDDEDEGVDDADFEALLEGEGVDTDDVEKAKKGKKRKQSLSQWAKEEEEEHSKGLDGDEDDDFEKANDDDSDDDDDDSDDETEKCAKKSVGDLNRDSLSDLVKATDAGGPVVDVSPFLETLVDQVSDADMQVRKALTDMYEEQSQYNEGLRKSVVALGNLVLDINKKIDGFGDLPVGERKTVLSKSEIHERFEEENEPDFTKAQVLDAMCDLAEAGKVTPIDVSRYETTNTMEPPVAKAVNDHLLQKSA